MGFISNARTHASNGVRAAKRKDVNHTDFVGHGGQWCQRQIPLSFKEIGQFVFAATLQWAVIEGVLLTRLVQRQRALVR